MLRKLHVLALAAVVALGGLTAATSTSFAGHRSHVTFGIGIGFGDHYGHRWHRKHRPYYRHWRPRHHGAYFRYRHYDPFPGYYVPLYRRYEPPIVYRPRAHYRRAGGSHVEWCHARYRSYRAWDNTFQPYYGPRRQCRSPYRY